MGTMRLFLHQHLIVESIKRIMTTFTFDALCAATVLTMYNNAALSLWKKMGLECFWSRIFNFEQHYDLFEEICFLEICFLEQISYEAISFEEIFFEKMCFEEISFEEISFEDFF